MQSLLPGMKSKQTKQNKLAIVKQSTVCIQKIVLTLQLNFVKLAHYFCISTTIIRTQINPKYIFCRAVAAGGCVWDLILFM